MKNIEDVNIGELKPEDEIVFVLGDKVNSYPIEQFGDTKEEREGFINQRKRILALAHTDESMVQSNEMKFVYYKDEDGHHRWLVFNTNDEKQKTILKKKHDQLFDEASKKIEVFIK